MRMRKLVVMAMILAAITAVVTAAIPNDGGNGIAVSAIYPQKADITDGVNCSGVIEGSETIMVRTNAVSRIRGIEVNIGDKVNAGDLLFTSYSEEVAVLGGNEEESLKYYAPVNGIVTSVYAQEGMLFPAEVSAVTISGTDRLSIRAELPETYIAAVETGQRAIIEVPAFPKKEYVGIVKKAMPFAKKAGGILADTGLYSDNETVIEVILDIDGIYQELMPGLSTSVRIITDIHKDALTLPYEAVLQDEDGRAYVFIVQDDIAVRRNVLTGLETNDCIEVLKGISERMLVIGNPPDTLYDGANICLADSQ